MSRKDELTKGYENPASKFLEWKSSDKAFVYWDKDKKENVVIPLPLKLVFLKDFNTIKGYSKKHDAGVWANEVADLRKEKLSVGIFENGKVKKLFTGYYDDIKDKLALMNGAKFSKSVYAMTPKGTIINLQLFGSGLGNFFELDKRKLFNHFLEIADIKEGKNGGVVFYRPVFKIGDEIPDDVIEKSEFAYEKVKEYYNAYKKQYQDEQPQPVKKEQPDINDDLPQLDSLLSDDLPF